MASNHRSSLPESTAAILAQLPADYKEFFEAVKRRVQSSQVKAALAVNQELILLYYDLGKQILERQKREGWGAQVIERLSLDLRRSFPEMSGFSTRNLKYMRAFADTYSDEEFVQQVAAQIPWGHQMCILDKTKTHAEREFYLKKTIEHGWSRNILIHQMESKLLERQGKAITNFAQALPPLQSDLAQQVLKDPYTFDFLTQAQMASERDLERSLTQAIEKFLLELGTGFAFVGRQYHLEVGEQDFYIDLLFYHYKLHCFVVIDLKIQDFKPADAGQMGFYLTAVDRQLRQPMDQPSIGLILCKSKNKVVVEYALQPIQEPIGVATYELKILESLPADLKGALPTVEELEAELNEPSNRQ